MRKDKNINVNTNQSNEDKASQDKPQYKILKEDTPKLNTKHRSQYTILPQGFQAIEN